jgi:RNA polymerase sigma factor (sigma-70 family)
MTLNDPPSTPDDDKLLNRWQESGDRDALDQLLRTQIVVLKESLRRKSLDRASMGASDFVSEAVFRYLRQSPSPHFDETGGLRAYLFRAARNLLIDHLRAHRGDTVRLDVSDSPVRRDLLALSASADVLAEAEQLDALEVGLNLLGDEDRRLIELSYFEGKSAPEVAEELEVAPEAVRMRLVRARRRLGKLLAEWQSLVD